MNTSLHKKLLEFLVKLGLSDEQIHIELRSIGSEYTEGHTFYKSLECIRKESQ